MVIAMGYTRNGVYGLDNYKPSKTRGGGGDINASTPNMLVHACAQEVFPDPTSLEHIYNFPLFLVWNLSPIPTSGSSLLFPLLLSSRAAIEHIADESKHLHHWIYSFLLTIVFLKSWLFQPKLLGSIYPSFMSADLSGYFPNLHVVASHRIWWQVVSFFFVLPYCRHSRSSYEPTHISDPDCPGYSSWMWKLGECWLLMKVSSAQNTGLTLLMCAWPKH